MNKKEGVKIRENSQLKELVADLSLKNQVLKKSLAGTGGDLDE